jgi:TatD DNase family protein
MIDSHCHLDPSVWGGDEGVDEVVARAARAGVDRLVVIGAGYGFQSAERALAVARRHARVRCAIGLHPHDAKDFSDARFADLLALAEAPEVLALGEMGLDYHYDLSPREIQRVVFREQLRAARRLHKPVVIHDRESDGERLAILDQEQQWEHGVLFHCYTGDVAMLREEIGRAHV